MTEPVQYIIFGILSVMIVIISWKTLFTPRSHGFYRFLSWVGIAWIFASNYPFWFKDPFSFKQIISWVFLLSSAFLVIAGAVQLKSAGKSERSRRDKSLYLFEKTTVLVDTGIYRYIRHPLYSSLLFLTWGIFFKQLSIGLLLVALLSSLLLVFTSLFDEKECIDFFGEQYRLYMKNTRRFIPFIF